MVETTLYLELAEGLPDLPRWVEARGLLLSRRCEVLLGPEGKRGAGYFLIESGRPLVVAVHRPVGSLVRSLQARCAHGFQLLAPLENAEHLRSLLQGEWNESLVSILVHPDPKEAPAERHATRLLTQSDASLLDELPVDLRGELHRNLAQGPMAAAFDGERPVAFCSAYYETEGWWDVDLRTVESHRRQGYGSSAASHLTRYMLALGKKPVWGALEVNTASLSMATRYGFRVVDRLVLFSSPGARDEQGGRN